jgi:hypothetical protein
MRITATIGALAALISLPARADVCPASPPSCDDTSAITNPVYVLAADTQVPVLHKLGKRLRADANPITIVYIPNGSCTNLANLYASPAKFVPGSGGGPYYVPADPSFDVTVKTACACTIPVAGLQPDLANTIVIPDAASCPTAPAKPSNVTVWKGPVQGMTFVVPYDTATSVGSSQKAITAEEAYLVAGLGPTAAMVPPWSDPAYFFGRPATKGTQVSIGANIGVPAAKWKLLADAMHQIDQSSALAAQIAALATDPNAEKVLGILGTEIYDKSANRSKMHALAFRAYKQQHAYWPDKTATSFDKQNVRDGHYTLWSYVEYLAPVGGDGKALKAAAQTIIDAFTGAIPTFNPAFDPIDDVIGSGLVPQCAMKVQRSTEGGDLALYSDPAPCACYYDSKATGSTTCTACDSGTPCATGTCRRGYCEAK